MARSLKVSQKLIKTLKLAFKPSRYARQQDIAEELELLCCRLLNEFFNLVIKAAT
ncbi:MULTISPECIES: hypothetical protein [Calothrix]|uniref:Transposase n=2 Tax=Calothrix TaxID=1186 RepID=A0ABR8AQ73_9CYAN|nr:MULTISPECIES: hypothetical protein [Calothrix]MBD2200737.1 hypothetical protein [Calothrix parietina FACHB-288]MBD2229793.1 hypothetical protein [Calothrix anomala FACHB-343]